MERLSRSGIEIARTDRYPPRKARIRRSTSSPGVRPNVIPRANPAMSFASHPHLPVLRPEHAPQHIDRSADQRLEVHRRTIGRRGNTHRRLVEGGHGVTVSARVLARSGAKEGKVAPRGFAEEHRRPDSLGCLRQRHESAAPAQDGARDRRTRRVERLDRRHLALHLGGCPPPRLGHAQEETASGHLDRVRVVDERPMEAAVQDGRRDELTLDPSAKVGGVEERVSDGEHRAIQHSPPTHPSAAATDSAAPAPAPARRPR